MGKPPQATDSPRRVWLYPRGQWRGPLLMRASDEYGRLTLALRLPGERALVWAYKWCTDPDCEACADRCPTTGYSHLGYVNGVPSCDHCEEKTA